LSNSNNPTPPSKFDLNAKRGFILGIPIFFVLLISAIIVYLIAGAIGWKGNGQVIAAMCIGPFVGLVGLALFFGIVRPKVV
jgi:hypothetical protein